MRINPKELSAQLTRDQAYLVGAWNNMVHAQSVDSHRVRVGNPESLLAEYQKMYEADKPSKGAEKKQVRLELVASLEEDPVVKHYQPACGRLLGMLKTLPEKEENSGGPMSAMARYSISELTAQIEQNYVKDALRILREVLIGETHAALPEKDRFRLIWTALNGLLSTLVARGMSLQTLHSFYRIRLLDSHADFAQRWDIVAEYMTGDTAKQFNIVIAIDDVSRAADLPPHVGGFNFSATSPLKPPPNQTGQRAAVLNKYVSEFPTRLFAAASVNARYTPSAGEETFVRLNTVLNLLRFEYETSPMRVSDMFIYQTGADEVKAYKLNVLIPNPRSSIDSAGASEFVRAVDELVSRKYRTEGLERIHAAFRLYRTGLDTDVIENKYLNWWTALEYLVKGGSGEGIGNSVENQVAPVLGVTYLEKHLLFHRAMLLDCQIHLLDPRANPIELKSLPLDRLLDTLRDVGVENFILESLSQYPYLRNSAENLYAALATPAAWLAFVQGHEVRARAHIQRLWRARCDIVHSASKPRSLVLLCANLEYYLKSVLIALLRSFRQVSTMSGPREFFDRQQHT
jgi:hypothetical protein